MHFACWVIKATNTHSEYVILIALPRQQWLRERASMLRLCYSEGRRTERRIAVALNVTGCGRFIVYLTIIISPNYIQPVILR